MPDAFVVFIFGTLFSFLAIVWGVERRPGFGRRMGARTGMSAAASGSKREFMWLLRQEAIRRVDRSLAAMIEDRLRHAHALEPGPHRGHAQQHRVQQTASLIETLFSRDLGAFYRDQVAVLSGPSAGSRAAMDRLHREILRKLETAITSKTADSGIAAA